MTPRESKFILAGLSYDPETGAIFKDGKRRDYMEKKSRVVKINRVKVMAHRLAWRLYHGEWPSVILDHANRDPHDNRISNLRECTHLQNQFNKGAYRTNTSGEKGVICDRINHRWQVRVFAGPVHFYANASHKISAIVAARLIRRVLHGDFCCNT